MTIDEIGPGGTASPGADAAPTCDFVGGALGHRLRTGIGRREPLPRAVGLKPGYRPRVVDATAGLGRDAIMLAALGLEVTLIERAPAMRALLAGAIARAMDAGGAAGAAAGRLTLLAGDARALLPGLRPDVVLVDPMHPDRTKSALVKQAMRQVRDLVGADQDATELMGVALRTARHRVVLKWPLRAPDLPGLPIPHHSITSKTLRFDVFMPGDTTGGVGPAPHSQP